MPETFHATVTIANGQSLSGAIDLGASRLSGIFMPAGWDAAALTFQASPDGANWFNVFDEANAEISFTVAAGKYHALPFAKLIGMRLLKLRSGTSAAAVNQTAERILRLVAERP